MHGGDSDVAAFRLLESEPDRHGRDLRPVDPDHDPAGWTGGVRRTVSVRTDDDHRAGSMRDHCRAHRPHQQAAEAPEAAAAHDHQFGILSLAQQGRRSPGDEQFTGDLDVGSYGPCVRLRLGQHPLGRCLESVVHLPVDRQVEWVADHRPGEGVNDAQRALPERCLRRRPGQRALRRHRAVDTDKDRAAVTVCNATTHGSEEAHSVAPFPCRGANAGGLRVGCDARRYGAWWAGGSWAYRRAPSREWSGSRGLIQQLPSSCRRSVQLGSPWLRLCRSCARSGTATIGEPVTGLMADARQRPPRRRAVVVCMAKPGPGSLRPARCVRSFVVDQPPTDRFDGPDVSVQGRHDERMSRYLADLLRCAGRGRCSRGVQLVGIGDDPAPHLRSRHQRMCSRRAASVATREEHRNGNVR